MNATAPLHDIAPWFQHWFLGHTITHEVSGKRVTVNVGYYNTRNGTGERTNGAEQPLREAGYEIIDQLPKREFDSAMLTARIQTITRIGARIHNLPHIDLMIAEEGKDREHYGLWALVRDPTVHS